MDPTPTILFNVYLRMQTMTYQFITTPLHITLRLQAIMCTEHIIPKEIVKKKEVVLRSYFQK